MEQNHHVDLLILEHIRRKNINARYSERAFAKSLGLSPGFLKLLFQGKKNISQSRAKIVADRLNWTQSQKSTFLKSVPASSKVEKMLKNKFVLSDTDFFEVSDWFHFAIIELIKVKKGKVTTDQICKEFNISRTEADFALKHLVRLEILKTKDSKIYSAPDKYEIPSVSSSGIRKYHKQMLNRAIEAIEDQPMEQRDLRGLTLAFDQKQISEAQKEIQKFVTHFEKKFVPQAANSVYQLSLAFFKLNNGDNI